MKKLIKEIDVLDVHEIVWFVPRDIVSDDEITEGLQLGNGNYRLNSINEEYSQGNYRVNLSVFTVFQFETIKELITDCQYELSKIFDEFTIHNSVVLPVVDDVIYINYLNYV